MVYFLGFAILGFVLGVAVRGKELAFSKGPVEFDNLLRADGSDFSVRSLLDCSKICSLDDQCSGFSHSKTLKRCQLHQNSLGMNATLSSMKYYVKNNDETTTTTIPTTSLMTSTTTTTALTSTTTAIPTTNAAACPSLDTVYTVEFQGGALYNLTITHTGHTKFEGNDYCNSVGATLAKIDTVDKQNTLSNMLITCPGLAAPSYWIDGQRDNSGQWVYTDLTAMSLGDTSLWASGSPRAPITYPPPEDCVAMRETMNYRWDNADCLEPRGVICLNL